MREEFESRCEGHDARAFPPFSNLDMDAAAEHQHPMAEPGDQAREIYDKWTDMVEGYSRRLLTKKPDKLPAIAGLARVAQTATGDGYMLPAFGTGMLASTSYGCMRGASARTLGTQTFERHRGPGPLSRVPSASCAITLGMTEVAVKFLPPKRRADEGFDRSHSQLYVQGPVVRMSSIRRHQFGAYYGGYDNFSPWACLPASLETCLDCLNRHPAQTCEREGK